MINWQSIFFNSFWVLGLAILLASFSYQYWVAGQENKRLRLQLNQPSFLRFFWLGTALIGIGLAGTSESLWEITIFILLSLFSLLNIFQLRQ